MDRNGVLGVFDELDLLRRALSNRAMDIQQFLSNPYVINGRFWPLAVARDSFPNDRS